MTSHPPAVANFFAGGKNEISKVGGGVISKNVILYLFSETFSGRTFSVVRYKCFDSPLRQILNVLY